MAWTGDAVYERTPVQQVETRAVVPGETATFQVRIENDADQPDRIGLSGSSKPGWTTQYLLDGPGRHGVDPRRHVPHRDDGPRGILHPHLEGDTRRDGAGRATRRTRS